MLHRDFVLRRIVSTLLACVVAFAYATALEPSALDGRGEGDEVATITTSPALLQVQRGDERLYARAPDGRATALPMVAAVGFGCVHHALLLVVRRLAPGAGDGFEAGQCPSTGRSSRGPPSPVLLTG